MSLVGLLLFLLCIGLLIPLLPLEPRIQKTVVTIVIVVAFLWLMVAIGVLPIHEIGVPRLR